MDKISWIISFFIFSIICNDLSLLFPGLNLTICCGLLGPFILVQDVARFAFDEYSLCSSNRSRLILHLIVLDTGSTVKSVKLFPSFFAPQKNTGEAFFCSKLLRCKEPVIDEYFIGIMKKSWRKRGFWWAEIMGDGAENLNSAFIRWERFFLQSFINSDYENWKKGMRAKSLVHVNPL